MPKKRPTSEEIETMIEYARSEAYQRGVTQGKMDISIHHEQVFNGKKLQDIKRNINTCSLPPGTMFIAHMTLPSNEIRFFAVSLNDLMFLAARAS